MEILIYSFLHLKKNVKYYKKLNFIYIHIGFVKFETPHSGLLQPSNGCNDKSPHNPAPHEPPFFINSLMFEFVKGFHFI